MLQKRLKLTQLSTRNTRLATVRSLSVLIWSLVLGGCVLVADAPAQPLVAAPEIQPVIAVSPPEIHPVVTFELAATPSLWADMRSTFELDHHIEHKAVAAELRWLRNHPNYLIRLGKRLQRHMAYVHAQVTDGGLPGEIALLPIVESAFDPYAFSHGGAAGFWQFVPATARHYRLTDNWWYDGRRDLVASTDAAIEYLTRLNRRFDDWMLALAGYNSGEGTVAKARRRAAPGAGFFDLKLPRETRSYVPRLLAVAAVVADPQAYGLTLPEVAPEIPFGIVSTRSQFDLATAAAAMNVELTTLYEWNPAIEQWATPPRGPHRLIVPTSTEQSRERFQQRLDAVPVDERVRWLRIQIASGDTLSTLAARHGTDVATLRKVNGLSGHGIRAGRNILIPRSSEAPERYPATLPVRAGRKYTVASGDSLWEIGRSFEISVTALRKANRIAPREVLRVGQELVIPGIGPDGPGNVNAGKVMRKVRYKVRRGDSLARIANKFEVAVRDIATWNNLDVKRYLQPGQRLILHVPVTGARVNAAGI
jgi:membrane-bound lytic murein transglycosylase D